MHPKYVVSSKRQFCTLLLAAFVVLGSASLLFATPADEVTRAVRAGGAAQVVDASPERFFVAYTAVISRVSLRQLPDYVTAAVRLRPDLSTQITVASIRAAGRSAPNPRMLATVVDRIVRAAILANPDAAVAIARAAVGAFPGLRETIVAAAIAAAPQDRLAIFQATAASASLAGLFRDAGSEGNFSVGFGSMSPANFSDTGGNVISPEQPPSAR